MADEKDNAALRSGARYLNQGLEAKPPPAPTAAEEPTTYEGLEAETQPAPAAVVEPNTLGCDEGNKGLAVDTIADTSETPSGGGKTVVRNLGAGQTMMRMTADESCISANEAEANAANRGNSAAAAKTCSLAGGAQEELTYSAAKQKKAAKRQRWKSNKAASIALARSAHCTFLKFVCEELAVKGKTSLKSVADRATSEGAVETRASLEDKLESQRAHLEFALYYAHCRLVAAYKKVDSKKLSVSNAEAFAGCELKIEDLEAPIIDSAIVDAVTNPDGATLEEMDDHIENLQDIYQDVQMRAKEMIRLAKKQEVPAGPAVEKCTKGAEEKRAAMEGVEEKRAPLVGAAEKRTILEGPEEKRADVEDTGSKSAEQQQEGTKSVVVGEPMDNTVVKVAEDLLQVPEGYQLEHLYTSFRRLCLLHHPDKNQDDPAATVTFQTLIQGYSLLKRKLRGSLNDEEGSSSDDTANAATTELWLLAARERYTSMEATALEAQARGRGFHLNGTGQVQ